MIFLACSWAMAQSNITRDTYVYSVKGADTLHLDVYVDRAKQQQSPQPDRKSTRLNSSHIQ